MLFNSLQFFILLGLTLILYWSSSNIRYRQWILVAASVIFYSFWYPPHLLLLAGLILISYLSGRLIGIIEDSRRILIFASIATLLTLGYWKYASYFLSLIDGPLSLIGLYVDKSQYNLALPLGISFITFQVIAYVVDVFNKKIPPENDPVVYFLFISFFPQLIAGPICRGNELLPQIKKFHFFNLNNFSGGFVLFLSGLLLKVGFADNLSWYVEQVYSQNEGVTKAKAISGTLAFSVQILADFWGYSTMAVGQAKMFGFSLPRNFNLPYLADSLQDFWRRWHITLSTWLRDYLYIGLLGGSRSGNLTTYRNLSVTFLLGGLWHGANTTFLVWGAIHGIYLSLERMARDAYYFLASKVNLLNSIWFKVTGNVISRILTLTVVMIAWVFFRADSVTSAFSLLKTSFDPNTAFILQEIPLSIISILIIFLVGMVPLQYIINKMETDRYSTVTRFALVFWMSMLSAILGSEDSVPFIYFQF